MSKKPGIGLSLTLLSIGAIVLILLFQLARVYFAGGFGDLGFPSHETQKTAKKEQKLTGNPFHDMASRHPKRDREKSTPRPTPARVPQFDHNPTIGNPNSAIQLTIFTDPLCKPCREQINQVLQTVDPEDVFIIFKFYPKEGNVVQSGMIEQMAQEQGVWRKWFNQIMAFQPEDEEETLSLDHMASMLADVGVDLRKQREILIKNGATMSDNLGADINLGKNLNFEDLPAFYLNNYRLGDQHLPLSEINTFIARLQAGESIFGG